MTKPYEDKPRSLGEALNVAARMSELSETHIALLTKFIDDLRAKFWPEKKDIPYFDPCDGGINAEILFLLEAPGPQAVKSGFVSRNNNDQTAENFFRLNAAVGISRERTIVWNIVPWYIGNDHGIRPPKQEELQSGLTHFSELLQILPKIRVVVFIGNKAFNAASEELKRLNPEIKILKSGHPSATAVNCHFAKQYDLTKTEKDIKRNANEFCLETSIASFLEHYHDIENKASHRGMRYLLNDWLDIRAEINDSTSIR